MASVTNSPLARSKRLVIETVGDETVIYDLDTNVAHALKPLAASVFMYADGKHSVAEITELASYRLDSDVTESEVAEAVSQLEALSLLDSPALTVTEHGVSRRDALKAFATAGAGTMLISSVAAPAALASTCVGLDCGQYKSGIKNGSYIYPQPTSWSGCAPNVTYGSTCTYKDTSGRTYTGEWQCVPCDHCFGYQCCQVVCAPTGTGTSWGTGSKYSVGPEYCSFGYYGKYCTPENNTCAPHCS